MSSELASIALVVGLFILGALSPGPNFVVVVERSMASGFRAGLFTGLGVAAGDALYAGAGLAGLAALVVRAGWLFATVKLFGGLYLAWLGARMLVGRRAVSTSLPPACSRDATSLARCFRLGLFTDLANPKTVVFFASIFATAYDPAEPRAVSAAMWSGIVLASVAWRAGLAAVFSRGHVRALYARWRRALEFLFGGLLLLFGLRLAGSARAR